MAGQNIVWTEGFEVFKTVPAISNRYISTAHNVTFGAGRLFPGRTACYATSTFSSLKIPVVGDRRHWTIGLATAIDRPEPDMKLLHTLKNNVDQTRLQVKDDGSGVAFKLEIRVGSGIGTLLWTSPVSFPYSQEIYFELKVDHQSTSTGSVQLAVNEFLLANLTSVITSPDGTAENFAIDIEHQAAGGGVLIDDMYAKADTADSQTFLGDIQFEGALPTSDHAVAWTRSTGATNFSLVDDASESDGDATYVSTNVDGTEDLYEFPDLVNIGANILCVSAYSSVRLVSSGSRNYKHRVKHGATTASGPSLTVNDTAYKVVSSYMALNPVTAAAWAVADYNAARIGQLSSP